MINSCIGIVNEVLYRDEHITKFNVLLDGALHRCINYNDISGEININDKVVLNTTAIDLKLGTGGYHFVISNIAQNKALEKNNGHIMKLKYTPAQFACLSAEEQDSKYHSIFDASEDLNGTPIIIGSLHSILAPVSICLKSLKPSLKIAYIMTDGGALPIWISDITRSLRNKSIIDYTITCGNAFGGDIECVTVYSALIAAKEIFHADVVIVCMGPGIVGTDTKYGFSGIEQGYVVDAVNKLNGYPIAVPRISFSDNRERHHGLSHHTITILGKICNTSANVAIPKYENEKLEYIKNQIKKYSLESLHKINYVDCDEVANILDNSKEFLCKMGKGYVEEKDYFMACGVSSYIALNKF